MGQRTQTIIKFENDEKDKNAKITFYNQWGYGRLLIYPAYSVLKSIETGIISDRYSFLKEESLMAEKLRNIMSVNIDRGIYTEWETADGKQGCYFIPAERCNNNDGFLFLDITDLKNPKYSFCMGNIDNLKIITAKEYWDRYKSSYDDWKNVDLSYVGKWADYIDSHAKLMSPDEINEFAYEDYNNFSVKELIGNIKKDINYLNSELKDFEKYKDEMFFLLRRYENSMEQKRYGELPDTVLNISNLTDKMNLLYKDSPDFKHMKEYYGNLFNDLKDLSGMLYKKSSFYQNKNNVQKQNKKSHKVKIK